LKCRHVAFWVALSACVALLAPAAASARTTWVVRDASGSRVGTVSGPKDTGSYWFYRHASAFIAYVFEEEVNLWYARNGGTAEGGYYIRRSNSAPAGACSTTAVPGSSAGSSVVAGSGWSSSARTESTPPRAE